ncbi:hypothetical protein HanXRQr2_Chr10g0433821 [Helianthus annuus]|uniref:Uncharacterized protein n=1 Tax=Helianthus annuus TaxID=4232 RepID=A0A9K3HWN9_HELAN|nr:hypothetical protein HanXRQr2_Chr10g0433821 [Helianthus annuus]
MSYRNEPAMSAKIRNKAGWMLSDQTGRVKSFKLRAGRICVHVGMLLATCGEDLGLCWLVRVLVKAWSTRRARRVK